MNVGELKRELDKYPNTMHIFSCAADIGGYDVTFVKEFQVVPFAEFDQVSKYPEVWKELQGMLYVGGVDEKR